MATQSINLSATNTVKFNGNDVQKLYLNSSLIWEKAFAINVSASGDWDERNIFSLRQIRNMSGCSFGQGYQSAVVEQLKFNLPSSFDSITRAAVKVNWNNIAGWRESTSPASNKYLMGYGADTPYPGNDDMYNAGPNERAFIENNQPHVNCGWNRKLLTNASYTMNNYGSNYKLYHNESRSNMMWGKTGMANGNKPTSTFSSSQTPGGWMSRVGFGYSPYGYVWRSGRGQTGCYENSTNGGYCWERTNPNFNGWLIWPHFQPKGSGTETVAQAVINRVTAGGGRPSGDWADLVKGARIEVFANEKNTNCPDYGTNGRGWDIS